MRKMLRSVGIGILSLWMTLTIPVMACHHSHTVDYSDNLPIIISGYAGGTIVPDKRGGSGLMITGPCLFCGRLMNPVPIADQFYDLFTPENGRVHPPDLPPDYFKPDICRLRDRSPPGSPIPC